MAIGSISGNAWHIAASGLRDAGTRLAVSAHNVANANTDGFVPDRVDSVALSSGGVESLLVYGKSPPASTQGKVPSQTDLTTEGVSVLMAKRAYQANVRLLKIESETTRTLLEIFG